MFAVIGAGYGDEGKGLITDYLAHKNPGYTVVRSNGGAQAGHTVQLEDGTRHVFSHFGSGTLAGAKTHLSRFMIVNPIMFRREHEKLGKPRISVSPECLVTIPQDMLLNQMREESRGTQRHGSCGMGINETVVRSETCKITVDHLCNLQLYHLISFRSALPKSILYPFEDFLYSNDVLEQYLLDVEYFLSNVDIVEDAKVDVNLIFEGAQGLGLDQNGEDFPHVTRSNTGIKNINEYVGDVPVDAYYVSRCYVSRHGAGPLVHEGVLTNIKVVDPTNQPNQWQGTLRTAPLDLDVLARRIHADMTPNVRPHLALTCLDQIEGYIPFYLGGYHFEARDIDSFIRIIEDTLRIPVSLTSYGPTRETIRERSY